MQYCVGLYTYYADIRFSLHKLNMTTIWLSHYHLIPDNFGTDKDINTCEVSKYITIKILNLKNCEISCIMIQKPY